MKIILVPFLRNNKKIEILPEHFITAYLNIFYRKNHPVLNYEPINTFQIISTFFKLFKETNKKYWRCIQAFDIPNLQFNNEKNKSQLIEKVK